MANANAGEIVRCIRALIGTNAASQRPDAELLLRFIHQHDEAAFTVLVQRHGPMVWGVCRRSLRHAQDAEDAFQATFLALAAKARSIRQPGSVASWLHGVAQHVAAHARAEASRWPARPIEESVVSPVDHLDEVTSGELRSALDDELRRLPERYRAPLVLCYLEERTQEEAARDLGWSKSTIRRRLDRGLELLRGRLTRGGATLSTGLAVTLLTSKPGAAAVPAHLVGSTVKAGMLVALGTAAATAGVSARVALLMAEAVKVMALSKLKLAALTLLAVTVVAAGASFLANSMRPAEQPQPVSGSVLSKPPAERPGPTDRHGDPLPEGALARLGTVRFRHAGWVRNVVFLPDGKSVASSSYDGSVRLWDAETGKELRRFPGIGFTISADGKTLACWDRSQPLAHRNQPLILWDVATGRQLQQLQAQPWTYCVAFSPDGKVLAAGGMEYDNPKPISLWEVSTGKELPAPQDLGGGKGDYASRLAFSPDGKVLATAREHSGMVQLWEVATSKEVTPARKLPEGGNEQAPSPFAYSPDGHLIASVGEFGPSIRIWETASGRERLRLSVPQSVRCSTVAFSPDGRLLASGHMDGLIHLWEVTTGKEVRSWQGHAPSTGHGEEGVVSLAFSADGKALVSGGTDRTVRLWDVGTGKALHPCPGHPGVVSSVALTLDGKTVISAGADTTIRLWDVAAGKEVRQLLGHQAPVIALALSPDGKILASKSYGYLKQDVQLRFWEMATGRQLRQCPEVKSHYPALAFSPDGQIVASAAGRGICLFDVATGKELCRTDKSQSDATFVTFSPDGKTFAWGSLDDDGNQYFHLSETVTGKEVRRIDTRESIVRSVRWGTFAPDSETLLVELNDRISAWSFAGNRELFHFRGDIPQNAQSGIAVALSSDSKTLATGNKDGTIYLWEVPSRKERVRFQAHEGAGRPGCQGGVASVAWSRDGKTLVSGGEDTTVLVWDVAALMGQGGWQPVNLTPQELEVLWSDLASDDARNAYRAIGRLIASPQPAVAFLGKQLQPGADPRRIARLIADLDDDRFQVRETATRELEQLGPLAEPALQQALAGKPSLEVRRRVERLLERRQDGELATQQLRTGRAIEVLEHIGTPTARLVLAALAGGPPPARQTQAAKAALERLANQSRLLD